ncbi:hypothetical protein B0H14DRAFT_3439603 [Mycena olivaceomarginata]|nr:hypothetical protein B0H14DRAFT_3439603 [Mycena olivaceomarginata]
MLRAAHLQSVYPVTAAEIEVSLWVYEPETKVWSRIETARELGISVLPYSRPPVGQGFLGGKVSSAAELPEPTQPAPRPRFPELAAKNGVTPRNSPSSASQRSARKSSRSLNPRASHPTTERTPKTASSTPYP